LTPTPLRRALFAVTERFAYLNHAAAGVLALPVRDALKDFIDAHAAGGIMRTFPYEARMPEYRRRIASFIGARESQIAILRNTSDGANAIAAGLDWNEGDEIVLPDNEFPANVQPWRTLQRYGVVLRFVRTAKHRLTPDVLREHLSSRTKLVALSWISFADGYRHDLSALAEVAHARSVPIVVDAIQGLGAFPLDVRSSGVDGVYCGGAKWMLALQGVGFLYLEDRLMDRLRVAMPGWRSMRDMWNFLAYEQPFSANASRFEGGTPNFIGALSLAGSIALLEEADPTRIAKHVLELTDRLCEGLRSAGAQIVSERGSDRSSGVVLFRLPDRDSVALGKALQSAGIVTTYRHNGVRVSPHGYNTEEEIDAVIDAVSGF